MLIIYVKTTNISVESIVFEIADMNCDIPDAVYMNTAMGWRMTRYGM
jgi:hypothetical protein